jgi:hypothetical protein
MIGLIRTNQPTNHSLTSTSIDLKIFMRIQLQLIWLYMVFKMLEIISNTRMVDGHGHNSVKKGAIFEVGLIMLLLKMYLIFDVGLLRFLILTQTIVQSWLKLPLANYLFITTM